MHEAKPKDIMFDDARVEKTKKEFARRPLLYITFLMIKK